MAKGPSYYQRGSCEVWDFVREQGLNFHLGNAIKYIARAGHKTKSKIDDIEKANLSSELQVELANLREENVASRETMTAENQERLAELNVLVDFKKTNATLAQQMDLANLNNE